MADEILQKLIEFIQNASPVIWGALIKQVYIEAVARLAWAVFLSAVSFAGYRLGNYWRLKYADPDDRDLYAAEKSWGAYITSAIGALGLFALLVEAVKWLVNPEFYAIRLILTQISGGQ